MNYSIEDYNGEQSPIKIMKKRRNIYIIIWAALFVTAALVAWITQSFAAEIGGIIAMVIMLGACISASLTVWCINNIRYAMTNGRKQGGGFVWFIFFLLGLIIFPIIIVTILRHSSLGKKALGLK